MTAKRIRRATQMPTNDRTALDRMLAAANARADRAEAALSALESAPHVNETPKSEHDSTDVLTALPAPVAPSLRITGPNSDGEYWLHIKAGGRSGGVNLGGEHGPICKRLLDEASETGAKE